MTTKDLQYRIVKTESSNLLEKEVNDLVQNGWFPQGGVNRSVISLNSFSYETIYMQAMVKLNN